MSAPRFGGLHFWVKDLAATLAFYRLAGLPVPEDAGGEFASFELENGISLAFGTDELTRSYDPDFAPGEGKGRMAIQLDVDSREAVDEAHQRLVAAGHRSHLAPFDAFWRSRYCEVEDPDGNVVGFHSPRQPSP
ncbi:MAG: VOC family protein [Dehalococcoidia bacterium]